MQILISYSRMDIELVRPLKKDLEEHNFSVWLDEHQMAFGDHIATRIKDEILRSDYVLLIITPNIFYSSWIKWEIEFATASKVKILPVLMKGNNVPEQLGGILYADLRTAYLRQINFPKLIYQLRNTPSRYQQITPAPPKVAAPKIEKSDEPQIYEFKSPIVGTFYRAPQSDRPPYVKKGDIVEVNQVLCIVEAMKLFNEMESDVAGEIVEILVKDASPVEYDQPLFLIDLNYKKE